MVKQLSFDGDLRSLVEAVIGTVQRITNCSWQHGNSQVWRVETINSEEGAYYIKVHAQHGKYRQEKLAYENWLPQLNNVPVLIKCFDELHICIVRAVPGTLVMGGDWSAAELEEIYQHAGQWLRSLHDLEYHDDDKLGLSSALLQRAESWLQRAVDSRLIDREQRLWVESLMPQFVHLTDALRVPCHRDFTPRNWLWDDGRFSGQKTLSVIDFEHARADWWLQDIDRLSSDYWQENLYLRAPFYQAYGKQPHAGERRIASVLSATNAVSTVVWAHEHDDDVFKQQGQKRLRQLFLEGLE
ncbi:MAG: aminoglycoside phosphotransferase family protein [Planctomycetes bacterium]|nr:aminoglycoside phosphotransferase family protein [Planctomycetota bacterium]